MPAPSVRATNFGIALLLAGSLSVAASYAAMILTMTPPALAPWAAAFGVAATSVSLFILGAASRGPISTPLRVLLGTLFMLIVASFGAALALPGTAAATERLVLGLPIRLAIVFYGVGFIPLLALPIAFALTFEKKSDR